MTTSDWALLFGIVFGYFVGLWAGIHIGQQKPKRNPKAIVPKRYIRGVVRDGELGVQESDDLKHWSEPISLTVGGDISAAKVYNNPTFIKSPPRPHPDTTDHLARSGRTSP